MESTKIENLLDAYFEGNTSLEEENVLRDYFNSENVANHLEAYQPIFAGLLSAREEQSTRKVQLPEAKKATIKPWWYSAAAMLIVALGVGGFYFSQPQLSQEEEEALAAFEEAKDAMELLSENFNKGTERLVLVDQFTVSKNRFMN